MKKSKTQIKNTVELLNECLSFNLVSRQKALIESLTPKQAQLASEFYTEKLLRANGSSKIITRGGNHKWRLDEKSKFN